MTFWPFLHFFAVLVYVVLAITIIAKNYRSSFNWLLAVVLFSLALWSFGGIFTHSPSTSREAARFFNDITAVGWTTFTAIFFVWIMGFAGNKRFFDWHIHYLLIGIGIFFFFLQLNNKMIIAMVRQPYGWSSLWAQSIWSYLFYFYYFSVTAASTIVLVRCIKTAPSDIKKKQAAVILVGVFAPFFFGTLTDVVLPLFNIYSIPDIASIFCVLLPGSVVYAMVKYKFLTISPAMAAENIISTITDFLVLIDPEGRIVTANKAILNFLGYEQKDLAGNNFSIIFPGGKPAFDFDEMREKKNINGRECYFCNKNGIDVPVTLSVSALQDQYGIFTGFVCVARDITELKRTEDILWRAKEELEEEVQLRTVDLRLANEQITGAYKMTRDILQKAPFGIYVVNSDGSVEYVNDAMAAIAGTSADELSKTNIFSVDTYSAFGLNAKVRALFDENKPFWITGVKIDSYYAQKPAIVNYRGILIQEEAGKKALIFVEDITDKLRLEEELMKAHKLESVGVLAGGIAHDFNNILSIILSNVSFARIHAFDDPALRDPLLDAEKATRRARDLTQQLLVFSRGGMPVKKVVNIDAVIMETANFALQGSRSRAEFDIKPNLWPVEVDVGQINQVIQNLVINADQAMPQGGIVKISAVNVDIKQEQSIPLTSGHYVKVSVKDSGIGIPPEHLQKIFDPYFTTKQMGSGLGLAIAYSIIKKHNGLITVDSKLGEGAKFDVYLPACERVPDEVAALGGAVFSGHGSILIMDDEEYVRSVLSRSLVSLGYEVTASSNGDEALNLYSKAAAAGKTFDLVVLDLTVPGGMGGLKALEELKKINPFVKAVVSSGYSNDPAMSDYAKYGFIDVLAKPYDVKTLSETIYRAIHR
jgi:PAS domain S-box-containing protein